MALNCARGGRPSLLLLPSPPEPCSRDALSAAYRPPLEAAIARCRDPARETVLVVAVASPILSGSLQYHKTLRWAAAQSLVAGVYAVASLACARLNLAAHVGAGPGSVDVRVVLVHHPRGRPSALAAELAGPPAVEPNNTAVVDLATFAATRPPWATIFFASTEAGLQLRADFLLLLEGKQLLRQEQLVAVDGGISMNVGAAALASLRADGVPFNDGSSQGGEGPDGEENAAEDEAGHQIVCLGGTFDHLHAGHKLLLTGGALLLNMPRTGGAGGELSPSRFIVGVTGDELLKNKQYADLVQPWIVRARGVIDFLSTVLELRPATASKKDDDDAVEAQPAEINGDVEVIRASFRDGAVSVECVRIQDAFGPTITLPEITSLVVSAETSAGGKAVNDRRAELGWEPLRIYEVDVLDADDGTEASQPDRDSPRPTSTAAFASKISSTAIRKAQAEARG